MAAPSKSYFVCGTPRAGTSLLTGVLKSTAVAGRPEEYFWRDDMPAWSERWKTTTFADYLSEAIRAGTTPNGVFGAKLMWGYLDDFLGRLARLAGGHEGSDRALMERFFPATAFVWIRRDDLVAQAVSWAKAIQTGVWYDHVGRGPVTQPEFDFDQIESLAREAGDHNDAWQRWFVANEIAPFFVRYEDLVSDKVAFTRRTLAFLGIEPPEGRAIAEQTRRQSDALNGEWISRFRELRALRETQAS